MSTLPGVQFVNPVTIFNLSAGWAVSRVTADQNADGTQVTENKKWDTGVRFVSGEIDSGFDNAVQVVTDFAGGAGSFTVNIGVQVHVWFPDDISSPTWLTDTFFDSGKDFILLDVDEAPPATQVYSGWVNDYAPGATVTLGSSTNSPYLVTVTEGYKSVPGLVPPVISVTVPDVLGQAEATAVTNIEAVGSLTTTTNSIHSPDVATGNVISTTPAAGETVNPDAVIDLTISLGTATQTEPEGSVTGVLQAVWTFEGGTPEDASEFPTDGTRPSLGQNPGANLQYMTVSGEQAAVGSRSLKVFLDGINHSPSYRNQLKIRVKLHPTLDMGGTAGFAEFGEYWLGWSVYFPSSHAASNKYEILMQSFWRAPEGQPGERNPMLAVYSDEGIGSGNFWSGGIYLTGLYDNSGGNRFAFEEPLAPIVEGWTDFVQHIIWDYSASGTGLYEIWCRNSGTSEVWQKYITYNGQLGVNDNSESCGTWDLGFYKGWRSGQAADDNVTTRLCYLDEIRYALDDGNFDLVASKRSV